MCLYMPSMVFLKKLLFRLPVGLENERNPLGHSGHLRLQAVVGSIDTVKGRPHCTGAPLSLLHR